VAPRKNGGSDRNAAGILNCSGMKAFVLSGKAKFLLLSVFLVITAVVAAPASDPPWQSIDAGLDYGVFKAPAHFGAGDAKIVIVRIDPDVFAFRLLAASELSPAAEGLTVKEWAEKYRLVAAINAGMFQTDLKTNVGYMKNFGHINNRRINKKYASVFAFNPKAAADRPMIFDTDLKNIREIINAYDTVVQNLRLIKRPGINRWAHQDKRWSEAALGQDREGRLLFIFSKSPLTMHNLGNILLSLPIGIVCAQHLEGGSQASLYLRHNGVEIRETGRYGLFSGINGTPEGFLPVPNVIGITKKK